MKVGKHTLLIDGNYFVYSRLFVLPRPKSGKLLGDDKSKGQFMRKLAIDFASELRKLQHFVDDVVVAVDSKSWRKDLYPEADYKGTRKPDSSVDWDNVYEVYGEFQNILKSHGVTIQRTQGAEADDVIFGWSVALNDRGKSCIVWTGDKDLIQLVNHSKANDAHTIWYWNTKKQLYVYEGFKADMELMASQQLSKDELLFNMGGDHMGRDEYQHNILEWINRNKIEINEVDCDEFIFKKVLIGDSSDNIPSVVTWQKEMKNGKLRNYSITEKMATKIWDQYVKEFETFTIDYLFSDQQKTILSEIIYRVIGKSSKNLIKSSLNNNIALMVLHNRIIPNAIQNAIYKEIDAEWEGAVDSMRTLFDKDKILEGTHWLKGSDAPAGVDPFANMDIPEEKEPIKKVGKKSSEKETKVKPKTKNLNNLF
jgi:5'-3' exonuclease